MLTTNYYNDFFEFGQQKINFSFFELSLPDDDPVYTLKKVMEELDFSGLLANCSDKGRTGYNPIMMYAVVTYANMRGIRSVDRIVDLCERDLAFIWLTRGQKPKRDAFYDFKNRKLTSDVLDDLNYQFMRRLQKEGLITLKELFIDGTKIEAFPYKHVYLCGGQESIGQVNNLDFLNLKDFKNIAGSTEDLERKYRNLFPLVDKYLKKIYACKFRYSKENLWCIVLFLLIKRKLSIYSEQEIRKHLAQITIRRSDNFKPELAATLMFAKDIFQISEIAQALSPYVFTIFTGKTKTYKPENVPVYIGDLFELPIHIYINYGKSEDYISACLLADAFNYLFEEYKAVLENKKLR